MGFLDLAFKAGIKASKGAKWPSLAKVFPKETSPIVTPVTPPTTVSEMVKQGAGSLLGFPGGRFPIERPVTALNVATRAFPAVSIYEFLKTAGISMAKKEPITLKGVAYGRSFKEIPGFTEEAAARLPDITKRMTGALKAVAPGIQPIVSRLTDSIVSNIPTEVRASLSESGIDLTGIMGVSLATSITGKALSPERIATKAMNNMEKRFLKSPRYRAWLEREAKSATKGFVFVSPEDVHNQVKKLYFRDVIQKSSYFRQLISLGKSGQARLPQAKDINLNIVKKGKDEIIASFAKGATKGTAHLIDVSIDEGPKSVLVSSLESNSQQTTELLYKKLQDKYNKLFVDVDSKKELDVVEKLGFKQTVTPEESTYKFGSWEWVKSVAPTAKGGGITVYRGGLPFDKKLFDSGDLTGLAVTKDKEMAQAYAGALTPADKYQGGVLSRGKKGITEELVIGKQAKILKRPEIPRELSDKLDTDKYAEAKEQVAEWAKKNGYDVVDFNDGELRILNPDVISKLSPKEGRQPKAGGIMHRGIPEIIKKKLAQGITVARRDAPIRMEKDMQVKDVSGNKVTLPKGEEYTPFIMSNGQIWLHDGKNILINKNQMQNVENQNLVLGERQIFDPAEKQVEEVWKGGETRYILDELENEAVKINRETWSMSEDDPRFQKLSDKLAKIRDKQRSLVGKESKTKFSQYQLPGGENYREVLIKAPSKFEGKVIKDKHQAYGKDVWWYKDNGISDKSITVEPGTTKEQVLNIIGGKKGFRSAHWDEPNVLYHLRMNDRIVDGKKILFMEEVQSDWAKELRRKGERRETGELPDSITTIEEKTGKWNIMDKETGVRLLLSDANTKEEAVRKFFATRGVPTHPLLKNWWEHATKKILDIAMREGYDGISWTTGQQQADRYDLSKQVDRVSYNKTSGDEVYIAAHKGPEKIISGDYTRTRAEQTFGKEIAKKIFEGKDNYGSLKGKELRIGGEWAKNLYDKMLPKAFEKASGEKVKSLEIGGAPGYDKGTMQPHISLPKLQPKAGGLPVQPPEVPASVQKVTQALKEAKPIRGKQETLYRRERARRLKKSLKIGERVKGERGFLAEKGAFKGPLAKVDFESLRSKMGQEDIDDLFTQIKDSPLLNDWQKIGAREGLAKMFGEFGGKVPTKSELVLLKKVYGEEFVKAALDMQPFLKKLADAGFQLANIPRSIMASFDLSAPFRQGVFLIGRPKQFVPAFLKMFKLFGSTKAYEALQQEMARHPNFAIANQSGLAFTGMSDILTEREEQFMSGWAEKIPLVGIGIRASERAYIGFLNKLRFDVFNDIVKKWERMGESPRRNLDLTKSLARYINSATGRGDLGVLSGAAVQLNTAFFSPRLVKSRIDLINPVYYVKLDPKVRKEAIRDLLSFISIGMTVLALADNIPGVDVGYNPTSADFGKIRVGDMRIDVWGGFQQLIRLFAQLWMGKVTSTTSGRTMTLGEGYKPLTRVDILRRFFENKFSPITSFFHDMLKGRTGIGEKFTVKQGLKDRFTPMVVQDIIETFQNNPSLVPLSFLGLLGVGIQTYGPATEKKRREAERWKKLSPERRRRIEQMQSIKYKRSELIKNAERLREQGRYKEAAQEVDRARKLMQGISLKKQQDMKQEKKGFKRWIR